MKHKIWVLFLLFFVYLFTVGKKSGCSKEETETLLSPVQAIATIVQHEDQSVDVDLTLISTAVNPPVFVETAKEVRLRVINEQTGDTKSIQLRQDAAGHYTASSANNPDLYFEYGVLYSFDFELDDDETATRVSGGTFIAQVNAPDNGVTLSVTKAPAATETTAEIKIEQSYGKGILRIVDEPGRETYSNWNMDTPAFDGSKWNSLIQGSKHTIPAVAFPDSGKYTIYFAACNFVQGFDPELSSELGVLSGFLACDETSAEVTVP